MKRQGRIGWPGRVGLAARHRRSAASAACVVLQDDHSLPPDTHFPSLFFLKLLHCVSLPSPALSVCLPVSGGGLY